MEAAMKRFSLPVMYALIVLFIVSATLNAGGEALRISKEEVKAKLGNPNFIVLDVRTGGDWNESEEKIVGAVRVNPEKITEWSKTLAKEKEIVLYCA